MASETVAARNRDTGRWHTALAVSLSLHIAVVVYAVTAMSARRNDAATVPIEVTVLPEAAPSLLPPAPAGVVAAAATAAAPGRRPRLDRVANRPAPPPPAVADKWLAPAALAPTAVAPAAVESHAAVESEGLQGDLVVQAASAGARSGEGAAAGAAPRAHGPGLSTAPRMLPPAEGNGQLAIDPNEARYQPVIPAPLRKPGARFAPLVKLCVGKDGSVGDVTVMRPSDPTVDPAIVEKIRLFKFRPYLDHGRPIPFCFFREYRLLIEE